MSKDKTKKQSIDSDSDPSGAPTGYTRREALKMLLFGAATFMIKDSLNDSPPEYPEHLVQILPEHVKRGLSVLDGESNCFTTSINYHMPQISGRIMSNDEFKQILKKNFYELKGGEEIKSGDLLTLENPQEKGADNFHHAAIALDESNIVDKPDANKSALRITSIDTLNNEWDHYWSKDRGGKSHIRFWRYNENGK